MKKNLFFTFIFFLIFFSKNIFSSYNFDNSFDCCLFATATTLTHNCAYMIHKKCIFNFNQEDAFDVACARTAGIIGTATVLNIVSGGNCSFAAVYTPIIAHNIIKIIDQRINKYTPSEFYIDNQKFKNKEMK